MLSAHTYIYFLNQYSSILLVLIEIYFLRIIFIADAEACRYQCRYADIFNEDTRTDIFYIIKNE